MSKFTKQIKKTYKFEGDTVVVVMKRLHRKDAITLAPFMSQPDKDGQITMAFEDSLKFADKSCEVLLTHVVSLTGLTDDETEKGEMTKEDLFGEEGATYFMSLISEMMSDLMAASFAGATEEKKLEVPQEDTLKE